VITDAFDMHKSVNQFQIHFYADVKPEFEFILEV